MIKQAGESYSIKVIMTGVHHQTGSDRLSEASQCIDCNIVVNIQGDEPLVNLDHIDAIIEPLLHNPSLQIAVGVTPYEKKRTVLPI